MQARDALCGAGGGAPLAATALRVGPRAVQGAGRRITGAARPHRLAGGVAAALVLALLALLPLALQPQPALAGLDRYRTDQIIDYTAPAPQHIVDRYVPGRYVDYTSAIEEDSPAYDRCKTTHRCPRAYNHYDPAAGTYRFTKRVFPNGLHEPCAAFMDFENWMPGTVGWDVDTNYLPDRHPRVQHGAGHFRPFKLAALPTLYINHTCTITFNTTSDPPTARYVSPSVNAPSPFTRDAGDPLKGSLDGVILLTPSGDTQVAVFNFAALYLGPNAQVVLTGNRAIAFTSRSSAVVDTPLVSPPGELGGFRGALLPTPHGNNGNGPGSGSLRVYLQTLTTIANNIDEVQTITTTAQKGQTLAGTWSLEYKGDVTHPMSVDAEPNEVRDRIETGLPLAGRVQVSRSLRDDEGGYSWNVTFVSAPGDVPQMVAHSQLGSLEAHVGVETPIQGNTLWGHFRVSFQGVESEPIRSQASAQEVQDAISKLPDVVTAHVVRNDPTGKCEAGLCDNGPREAWGYEYQLTITTLTGVVVPHSPTSPLFVQTTPSVPLTANSTGLEAVNASISVVLWQNTSRPNNLPPHPYSHVSPFNLPFGGAGASFGGVGGLGHARHSPPPTYLDDTMPDLQGGSGGAVGGELPQQALAHASPSGRGGDGGGAIEIIAHTDIVIGASGGINVDGQDARDGYRGGGGGSGGGVLLVAGSTVTVHSLITATGGKGGNGLGHGSRGGGGGGGGRVAAYGQSITVSEAGGFIDVAGGKGGIDGAVSGSHNSVLSLVGGAAFSGIDRSTPGVIDGNVGSVRLTAAGGARYRIDREVGGAADTQRSLRVTMGETAETDSGVNTTAEFGMNGPSFALHSDLATGEYGIRAHFGDNGGNNNEDASPGQRPDVFTVYARLGIPPKGGSTDQWGLHIALHEFDLNHTTNLNLTSGEPLPGLTAYPLAEGETNALGNDATALIGVAMVDGNWVYDANYRLVPGAAEAGDAHVFARNVEHDRWYKIDIVIDWTAKTYLVRLDDIIRVQGVSFVGEAVRRVGTYVYQAATAWFDEIYIGPGDNMGFECPFSREGESPVFLTERPIQHAWKPKDIGEPTYSWDIVRHDSHLSRRRTYSEGDFGGVVFYDGAPHRRYHSDIMTKTATGDRTEMVGNMHAGNLVYLPGDGPSDWAMDSASTLATLNAEWGSRRADDARGEPGRFFWFAEHDGDGWLGGTPGPTAGAVWYSGGVTACSTTDLITWKNEGIMFHFTNVTDGAYGRTDLMRVERPKTMFNNRTNTYVMWMHADNTTQGLRLAGVAQGGYVNGPYVMYDTLLPDGNETVDLTIFRDPDGTAHLARTYYASIPYYMPKPIMQPLWESVKFPDGSTDFALNYHRAFYHAAYDNPDDIYQQRWRYEHLPWEVVTQVDSGLWVETYDDDGKLFVLENTSEFAKFDAENAARARSNASLLVLDEGFDPDLQATGVYRNLTSRDPLECDPLTCVIMGYRSLGEYRLNVLAQVLGVHARRDIRGQGQPPVETRYKDPTDPKNNLWSPNSVPAVKPQRWGANYLDKNIADNPPHTTPPDILMGLPHIVETRRAKYAAVSRLTDDYLSTNGEVWIVEGELEDEGFLMSIIADYGQYGWNSGDYVRTTYPADAYSAKVPFNFDTASDWYDRLHQFYEDENDRADDFVNFRDKKTSLDHGLINMCPRKHQACQDKYAECQVIWAEQVLKPEVSQLSWTFEMKSYSIAQPTLQYETCLAEHRQCLEEYQHCVQTRIPRDRS